MLIWLANEASGCKKLNEFVFLGSAMFLQQYLCFISVKAHLAAYVGENSEKVTVEMNRFIHG